MSTTQARIRAPSSTFPSDPDRRPRWFSVFGMDGPTPYWVGTSYSGNTTVVHKHCPLDYCMPHDLPIDLSNHNEQFNRSGTLCGGCKTNLSAVFGSSQCLQCSHWWLFLVPLFALVGIALVFLLTVLNLTVSIGTINGLIFYANIVRANMAIFFPPTHSTAVMIPRVFIAWLNLDIGIDVCFYNGMDTYAKTWLQLVFPAYLWTMMIVIIVSSRYFTWAAKLSGKNSVPVLATLFLLSYAKLLRFIVATFSFTTLITYQKRRCSQLLKEVCLALRWQCAILERKTHSLVLGSASHPISPLWSIHFSTDLSSVSSEEIQL